MLKVPVIKLKPSKTCRLSKKGTTPSDVGGKPVILYKVADPRIVRIINNDPAVFFSDLSEED